jgi:hypothetical protein
VKSTNYEAPRYAAFSTLPSLHPSLVHNSPQHPVLKHPHEKLPTQDINTSLFVSIQCVIFLCYIWAHIDQLRNCRPKVGCFFNDIRSYFLYKFLWPPLWSSSHSSWLLSQRSRVRFLVLPNFSSNSRVWNGVHSALVRINEELLERKISGSGVENWD